MRLLHGSEKIIEFPTLSGAKPTNDYGCGLYCTLEYNMACEWACKNKRDGYVNQYDLNTSGLKELNLTDGTHNILEWIALLLKNRQFSLDTNIAVDSKKYILENFDIDITDYDLITGYRADDSYFAFAESFISNGLSLKSLSKALYLGKLGLQTVLVSDKAFNQMKFIQADPVQASIYYPRFKSRDELARETFFTEIQKEHNYEDDIFMLDIIRLKMRRNDDRIPRIIFK